MRINNKREKRNIIISLCILLVVAISIGYAILTEQLKLDGTVNYGAMAWDVGFTTAVDGGGTVTSIPSISNDKKSITVTCDLGKTTKSETCIVKATIKNASTFTVLLNSNPTITYDNTYINSVTATWTDTNKNVLKGDILGSSKENELQITIITKELTKEMLPEASLNIPITITMDWVEKSSTQTSGYLDLSNNVAALMSYYMPYTQVTMYSGLNISEITVKAKEAGTINIGTAKIVDVLEARKNGTPLTTKTESYNVIKGTNVIPVSLNVGNDETIVIGGNNSIAIEYKSDNNPNDEEGLFTVLDNVAHGESIFSEENEIKNKLSISVETATKEYVEIVPGLKESFGTVSKLATIHVEIGASPWSSETHKESYKNTIINRIDIAVQKVSNIDDQQYVNFYVIDIADLQEGNIPQRKATHKIIIPYEEIKNDDPNAINRFISVTDLNIEISDSETLAIGYGNITIGYLNGVGQTWQAIDTGAALGSYTIGYSAFTLENFSISNHIENIKKENARLSLVNKNVSILGDSISTYNGYSNNGTESNSTIGSNGTAWYPEYETSVNDVSETWWMQSINEYNMNLLVNNSITGSLVFEDTNKAGYKSRAINLHDNTGNNAGTAPDIIFVYMGTNDAKVYKDSLEKIGTYEDIDFSRLIVKNNDSYTYETPTTFAEAYAIMIHKIVTTYSSSDVFTMNLPQRLIAEFGETSTPRINDIITKVANKYGATVIDLYSSYPANSGVHPNASGMDSMTQIVNKAIKNRYIN